MKSSISRPFVALCTLLLIFQFQVYAAPSVHPTSVLFEENKGQWDSEVRFRADLNGFNAYYGSKGFTYHFLNKDEADAMQHRRSNQAQTLHQHAVKVDFIGANENPTIVGENPLEAKSNYFLGTDTKHWTSQVESFSAIRYTSLYPGIDAHIFSTNQLLEYAFDVAPEADPSLIRLSYSGADKIQLKEGILIITTSLGTIRELKPRSYQTEHGVPKEIPTRFIIKNNTVSFALGKYNKALPLTIDPVLVVSTYTGSNADNWGYTATYDAAGNIYTGGIVLSTGYPITAGAFQQTFGGGGIGGAGYPFDIVITKFNPTGSLPIFSTYLGGSNNEAPNSLVVDAHENLIIFGVTYSSNFPMTASSYDNTYNGGGDMIVSKLNATGSVLLASTFIGGTGEDGVNISALYNVQGSLKQNYGDDARGEVICDNEGNVYVASCTKSIDYPTLNAYQSSFAGGGQDAVFFKLDSTLTSMSFNSYLGGNTDDAAYGLVNSINGEIIITGGTGSSNFPSTPGALHTTYLGGATDGFVCRFSSTGNTLINSSFIGTDQYDQSYFITLDASQNVYLYGQTAGAYPVTSGVYSNTGSSQFIHKLSADLSTSVFSTVFGNGSSIPNLSPTAFMVDTCMNIYASGWGRCLDFGTNPGTNLNMPISANAFQNTTDGCDFYFIVLRTNASSLLYGSYFGINGVDEHVDGGTSRFDQNGRIYQSVCAGCGGSDAFPTTPNAWSQTNNSSNCNNAVIKYDFELQGLEALAVPGPFAEGCAPLTVQLSNFSNNAEDYIWSFDDGSPIDTSFSPNHTFANAGVYNVMLVAIDSASCTFADTGYATIHVYAPFSINLGNDTLLCGTPSMQLDAGIGGTGFFYTWSNGEATQAITATSTGTYFVTAAVGGCFASDTIVLGIVNPPQLGNDTTTCLGNTVVLDAGNPGATYLWSTGDTSRYLVVSQSADYIVSVSSGGCSFTDTLQATFLDAPLVNLGNDTVLCGNALLALHAGNLGSTYTWSNGQTSESIVVNSAGYYFILVDNGSCNTSDSILVSTKAFPILELGPDLTLCNQDSILLSPTQVSGIYTWNNGSNGKSYWVHSEGVVSLKINDGGCTSKDSLKAERLLPPVLANDTIFCGNILYTIGFESTNGNYHWSNGDTTKQTLITQPGTYQLTLTKNTCALTDSITIASMESAADTVFVPNVFTPNNDGINDVFEIVTNGQEVVNLQVYNRWGLKVFETNQAIWDGTYPSGTESPDGVYYYLLEYQPFCPTSNGTKSARKGFLTLSR